MSANDMDLMFTCGSLLGTCDKCGQPATGQFDSDEDRDEDDNYWVTLQCVGCGTKAILNIWPDTTGSQVDAKPATPRDV